MEHLGLITPQTDIDAKTEHLLHQHLHAHFIGVPTMQAADFVSFTASRMGNVIEVTHVVGGRDNYNKPVNAQIRQTMVYCPSIEGADAVMSSIKDLVNMEAHITDVPKDPSYGHANGQLKIGNSIIDLEIGND